MNQDRLLINQGLGPLGIVEGLIDTVVGLNLHPGAAEPLLAILNAALVKLETADFENDEPVSRSLQGFVSVVEARKWDFLDITQAELLIVTAEAAIARISNPAACIK